jgi:signal transduction histidine kinase
VASGRRASELVGRPLLDVYPELRGGDGEEALRRALSGQTVVLSQRFHRYLLPLPAGPGLEPFERMQQSARLVPLLRDDAQVDGVLVLIQDVTERVAREEELRQAMQRVEEASSAKSRFLAAMSHELRTPLSAVVGYVSILEGELAGPITAEQRRQLGRIKASANHVTSIIDEILTFSRVEAGKESLHLEDCDAAQLARDAAALLEPQADQKGLALEVTLPERTPLRTDTTKVRQILVNLLGNAVKFTDEGVVALAMSCESDRVIFRVRDTGPGISPDDLERVFEPFTQVEQSYRRGGTGLGLPVSRKLAHLLGGDIELESLPGQGSTFTLWLPLSA